jgi:hypothetical protein
MLRPTLAFLLALSTALSTAQAADLTGQYAVDGSNPDGDRYTGTLTLRPLRQGWSAEWRTPDATRGIGLSDGRTLVLAYGGSECGVVAWDATQPGRLAGQWTLDGSLGREQAAAQTPGSDRLDGRYDVSGESPEGEFYKGSLQVRRDTGGYALRWDIDTVYTGTGIEADGVLGAAWGDDCGVAIYRIDGDRLIGKWRTPGAPEGSELLQRR